MSGTIRESPADFRNGDLISRLLAATPPYQTNSTFVPPGLYFSEMLKRFVQAKSCPPLSANKRGRKRIWKDGGGKAVGEQPQTQPSEAKHKKTAGADFAGQPPAAPQSEPQLQFPPLWYPPFYPAAYPPPPPLPTPVYFETPEPLNLRTARSPSDPVLKPDRHYSAFRVPEPSSAKTEREQTERMGDNNKRGTNYLMGHLTKIYRQVAPPAVSATDEEKIIDVEGNDDGPETTAAGSEDQQTEKKDCKDLTALIGLELVVDYVKHGNGKDGRNEPNVKCCRNS